MTLEAFRTYIVEFNRMKFKGEKEEQKYAETTAHHEKRILALSRKIN